MKKINDFIGLNFIVSMLGDEGNANTLNIRNKRKHSNVMPAQVN
ncbi:MAG TPA: hypothetical protein PKM63_09610 [Panacibacter sp.]|nr:hypothetical protein [Panacibacter sp.]